MESQMDYEQTNGAAQLGPDDGIETSRSEAYRLLFGENGLDFRALVLPDPVPVGRQILETAGIRAVENWALIALLPSGAMEDVRLGEAYDLRGHGAERVIAFMTDTLFRGFLQGQDMLWGRKDIRGEELYALARLDPGEMLYIDVPGGTDIPVAREDVIDLSTPGVERFIAGSVPVPQGFEVLINYNGVVRSLRVRPQETIAAVIEAARPLFGNPGGDLVLVDPGSGRILEPGHTVAQEGVQPGAHLQLRPRAVQGG